MKSTKDLIAEAANSYKYCPSSLSSGVVRFSEALTPSHSLTSRRYSVWALLKRHVDQPFADALRYQGVWHRELLSGFSPSRAGRHPGPEALTALGTYEPLRELAIIHQSEEGSPSAETISVALERWYQCLRMSIHSCYAAERSPTSKRFGHALDLMKEVLHLLKNLRPRHRSHPVFGKVREINTSSHRYCELCWRPSMRSVDLRRGAHKKGKRLRSARFCEIHDPSDKKSRYRTDLNYKAAFKRELEAIQWGLDEETSYALELPGLPRPDIPMQRRLAYDRVHAGIRSPNSRRDRSLKERVWLLKREGKSVPEIAKELGMTRQTIHEAVTQLRSIWIEHQLRLRRYHLS